MERREFLQSALAAALTLPTPGLLLANPRR
jgi:hypothetical protein